MPTVIYRALGLCFIFISSCDKPDEGDLSNRKVRLPNSTDEKYPSVRTSKGKEQWSEKQEEQIAAAFPTADAKTIDDLAGVWASVAPENAFAAISSLPTGQRRIKALLGFFGEVELSKIEDFWNRLERDGIEEELSAAISAVSMREVTSDPQSIMVLAEKMNSSRLQSAVVAAVARDMSRRLSLKEASDLLLANSGNVHAQVFNAYIAQKSSETPREVVDWLGSQGRDNNLLEENLPAALLNWSNKGPADAVDWIKNNWDIPASRKSFEPAFSIWLTQESGMASEWASSLPVGEVRDWAALEVIRHLVLKNSLDGVSEWANTISSPEIKKRADLLIGIRVNR